MDEEDGRTERLLKIASPDDDASDSLLSSNVTKSFWNDHLWLSVGYRKSRSTFTRVQRLSVCLSILFLTMITNAMFYGTGDDDTNKSAFQIGPLSVTIQQLYTSIASSIIIIPPIILITTFFSKSAERKEKQENGKASGDNYNTNNSNSSTEKKKAKKKLPYWCIYIAYALVFLCIASGAFFTILYALQWGKAKSEAWLVTFVLSFVQSLFLVQPIKVCVLQLANTI